MRFGQNGSNDFTVTEIHLAAIALYIKSLYIVAISILIFRHVEFLSLPGFINDLMSGVIGIHSRKCCKDMENLPF